MLWSVDPGSAQPLYEQIAAVVRRGVVEGTLRAGDRLPAARELAASLDVNLHTVLRAYQGLRDEGVIELRRGRGAVVVESDVGSARLREMVDQLVSLAARLGMGRDELARLIVDEDGGERHGDARGA